MFLFSHSDNWYMADVQKLLWMRIPGGCQLIIEKTVRPIFPPAPRERRKGRFVHYAAPALPLHGPGMHPARLHCGLAQYRSALPARSPVR